MKTILLILFTATILTGCVAPPADGSRTFVIPLSNGGYDYCTMTKEQLEARGL